MSQAGKSPGADGASAVALTASRQFASWLAEQRVSVAFTTYQTGKLFLIGTQPDGRLSVFERTFNRAMGLWSDGQTLWMTSLYQVWRFENVLQPGQMHEGYDRLYVPRVGYTTGDVDAHDIAVGANGEPVFVNTLFSCLATVSERHSFTPLWRPPFISRLAAEDRCHLNGLAMEQGRPRFVTACSRGDAADAWRDHRQNGGGVIDVATSGIVIDGLSMPHSPRLRQDALWLLDSGTGFLGYIDVSARVSFSDASRSDKAPFRGDAQIGAFEQVTFCPGYARGLALYRDFAIVGLSKPRENHAFTGLALEQHLAERRTEPRCGLAVIHLATGDLVHWLWIDGVVSELYDVAVLPNVRRPMALGFKTDEIRRTIDLPNT
jgi:uncharacterized protein (TIGR03032 family)